MFYKSAAEGSQPTIPLQRGSQKHLRGRTQGNPYPSAPPPHRQFPQPTIPLQSGWFTKTRLVDLLFLNWAIGLPTQGGRHKVPAQGSRHKVGEPPPSQGRRPPPGTRSAQGFLGPGSGRRPSASNHMYTHRARFKFAKKRVNSIPGAPPRFKFALELHP